METNDLVENDNVDEIDGSNPVEPSNSNSEPVDSSSDAVDTAEPVEDSSSERPEYISEDYWKDGKADIEKLSKDLSKANEMSEGLRKKLSTKESKPKEAEEYDSVFSDNEFDETQRDSANKYAEIAKKHGLTKKQAEDLITDIAKTEEGIQSEVKSESREEILKELGENASQVLDGLESYAHEKVNSGSWTEEDKHSFGEMVYDAKSARLMSELLGSQKDSVNLSGMSGQDKSSFSMDDYYIGKEKAYTMIKEGDRSGGESLIKELDLKYKNTFS